MRRTTTIFLIAIFSAIQVMATNPTLEVADDLFNRLAYTKAADFYNKYLNKNDDVEVLIKLSKCYDKTNDYENLEATLLKIVSREDNPDALKLVEYGQVLQILEKHQEAIVWYEKYLDEHPDDNRAQNQLKACKEYVDPNLDRYTIGNMEFNSEAFEYSTNFLNRTLLYTSTSSEENTSVRVHNWTDGSYSDLKQHQLSETEVFILFNEMDVLNTRYDDGPFTIDPTTQQIYYTRNNYDIDKAFKKKGTGFDKNMNLKIYVADNDLGRITNIREFDHNFEAYNTGHPSISPDGQYLVFTCDYPEENVGGRDLYYCLRDSAGWAEPKLLNTGVNTEGDELFPYFHENGALYFASNGLGSIGGLDVFRAEIDFENNSLKSLNRMAAPVNSTYDDFGIVFSNRSDGYFTSDRPDGKGHDDIYSFVDNTILLKGLVVNIENDEILPGSYIKVADQEVKILEGETNGEARFQTRVYKNKVYDLLADEELFLEKAQQVSTKNLKSDRPIKVTLKLQPIRYNVKVVDKVTNLPISGADVQVTFGCDQEEENLRTRLNGMHILPTYKDCKYEFKAKADGYLAEYHTWQSPKEDEDQTIVIYLSKISYAPIVLKSIYYDFDKSFLRISESSEDLDKLYRFVKDNPELTIQINSHTDARATHLYNEALSQRRAQSVVNYLVGRGVGLDRLKPVGFGERVLTNNCSDNIKCSEEEHQMNRRTEFQVINADGSVKIKSDERTDIKIDPCLDCDF